MNKTFPLLVVASVACLPGIVSAQSITVPNFSFESPQTSGYTNGNGNGQNDVIMASWIFSTPRDNNSYGVEVGAGKFTTGLQGQQYGYINSNETKASITSISLVSVAPDTAYTYTIGLGRRLDNNSVLNGTYTLSILLDGMAVASTSVSGNSFTTPGVLNDYAVTFNSLAASSGMLAVQVAFENTGNPGPGNTAGGPFDNVRFDFAPIPEPSTVWSGLGGTSLLLGLLYRRNRRAPVRAFS